MPTFHMTRTTILPASATVVRRLIQDEPLEHLKIIGVHVEENELPESGECTVVEELSIPFIPKTRFKAKFTRIPGGSKWESWASMGVFVDTRCTVDEEEAVIVAGSEENKAGIEVGTCQATEECTMTCPFYVYPIVKWQILKSHPENSRKLKSHLASL